VVVNGDLTNEATSDLSSLAEIGAVFFDSSGAIVGGANTYLPVALPPGSKTGVEIDSPLSFAGVSQAKVSVDPYYATP
jgi:hypothetical protein